MPGITSPADAALFPSLPSSPILNRGAQIAELANSQATIDEILRADAGMDITALMRQLALQQAQLNRAITSTTSNLPVRENLEAEASILIPMETPMRNRIPRRQGSGLSSLWRTITSLGGGYSAATTSTASGNTSGATSLTLTSAAGFNAGDTIYITGGTAETAIISTINYSTGALVLTANLTNTQNSKTVTKINFQGPGAAAIRAFFAETGAPADHVTAYASNTMSYKLMGTYGSVTGLAAAGGANFQDQIAVEKRNAINNLMLNEENAIINGSSTVVLAPWGDGTNALGYDGLVNLITTGNGTPAAQIQTAVGALTTAHIDAQLSRLFLQGSRDIYMIMNPQESTSLAHLAEASGNMIKLVVSEQGKVTMGVNITKYISTASGEEVDVIISRFVAPGTIIFGCDRLPDGRPALDIEVLPQVQLPQLAPNEMVQGYTAQELAPTTAAPQVYPFIVTVYEVLRMKSYLHFAISKGITAV